MGYRLTKKQKSKEILVSTRNPVYFIDNFVRVAHPDLGLIPLKTFKFQKEVLGEFQDHRHNIILKGRQLGISTITAAFVLWLMLFNDEKSVLVVATKQGTAANLLRKVLKMYENLPQWMQDVSEVHIKNQSRFELKNGSFLVAEATSGNAGRSEALSLLVIDEAATVEGLDEMWTSLRPTLALGGNCIVISTPKGASGWYYEKCMSAMEGTNNFNLITLPWYVHPDRDQKWFEEETAEMDIREIAQEYECDFNLSGDTFLNPDDIKRMKEDIREPLYKIGPERNYWIWEKPVENKSYLATVDVSRGDGADFSTVVVLDPETMTQVAEYKSKIDADKFPALLYNIGKEYNYAFMVIESNNLGWMVAKELANKLRYPNLYWENKSTKVHVPQIRAINNKNVNPGFTNSLSSRPLILEKFAEYVRNEVLTIRSARIASELDTFIWKNGKAQAQRGKNDDLIIPLAIACWVRETVLIGNPKRKEMSKSMLAAIGTSRQHSSILIPGMRGYNKNTDMYREGIKKISEHGWVLD